MYKILILVISFTITSYCQDNQELKLLYEQDQNARKVENIDWPKLIKQDSVRRVEVNKLVVQNKLSSSNDYFRAAMIFQHGNKAPSYKTAWQFAQKAFQIDSTNRNARWLIAASYDRYLISKDKPQIYGTQFVVMNNKYYLQRIDTTKVSDKDRIYYGTRTLQEIRDYLTKMNGEDKGLLIFDNKKFRRK